MRLGRFAALCATLGLAGCGPGERPRERPLRVVHDLARLAWSADSAGACEHAAFGTPNAARLQVEGFVKPLEAAGHEAGHEPFLLGRPNVTLRVGGQPGAARRVVLDFAPYGDNKRLKASVRYNGRRLGALALVRGRHRYLLDLPETGGAPRGNELALRFRGAARHARPYGGQIAATFYSLTSGAAGDKSLDHLASHSDLPAPLSLESRPDGLSAVVQGPGALRYALELAPGEELRFSPGLASVSGAKAATLAVSLATPSSGERELWRGAAHSGAKEVRLALPGQGPALLTLHVEGVPEARAAWSAPRVMGEVGHDRLAVTPRDERDEARADALRKALSGMNVMLVILDAAGARHFSCYGYSRRTTPEIDRLAAEGVLFERAYTPAVYTLPAMSSLLTSLDPDEHGSIDLRGRKMPSALSLPDVLAARNIHTGAFVANGVVGRSRGFDRSFADFHELYTSAFDPTQASRFRDAAYPWLQANRDRRFFAWLHFREPHFPYDPPPPFDTAFGAGGPIPKNMRDEIYLILAIDARRRPAIPAEIEHWTRLYDGNLAYADQEIGALRRKLEETGLLERTVLIIAADHGEALWEHEHIGHEVMVYEEETHVPLIVRFPRGTGPAGVRIREFVSLSDLAPTIADSLGLWRSASTRPAFRTQSLLPVILGAAGRRAVVTRDRGEEPRYALREGSVKAISNTSAGTTELYDLATDPGEQKDLAVQEPIRAAFYRQTLAAWILSRRLEGVAAPVQLTPDQQENLKALGYIQ